MSEGWERAELRRWLAEERGVLLYDTDTLLEAIFGLRQERDEARAMLAHVAGLLKRQVERADLDEWTKVHLAVAMSNAECGARGRI